MPKFKVGDQVKIIKDHLWTGMYVWDTIFTITHYAADGYATIHSTEKGILIAIPSRKLELVDLIDELGKS